MATINKSTTTQIPENRFNSLGLGETTNMLLSPQVESHVEPYELVELFYGNHPSNEHLSNSPAHPSSQVGELPSKSKTPTASYKCEICCRIFKEASHFSKHKRGALCRKSAQKLAKKHKKKIIKETDPSEKKTKMVTSPYKPFLCNLCGAKFLDKVNVELHLQRTHNTQQPHWLQTSKSGGFACSECDLWFADKAQLRHHQQQHSNTNSMPVPLQNEPPPVNQQPLPQQPMPPPPPQYYFQPLQHIQTFTAGQIHQLGPPAHQPMQQMSHVGPPQGHSMPTYVVPHSHNPQNTTHVGPTTQPQPMPNNCVNPMPTPVSICNPSQPSPTPRSPLSPQTPQTETSKPIKVSKVSYSNNWTTSRKNVCGDCGFKFVDPINLELHMQRKHPDSSIVETVGLGGGLTLYKTNKPNCNSNNIIPVCGETTGAKPNCEQTFDCVLCGFKATSMSSIVKHLQTTHNTNNANFISVCENDSHNISWKTAKRNCSESDMNSENCKCDTCFKEFDSKESLTHHAMKERNFLCGICNFSSCSDARLTSHMYSFHKGGVPSCLYEQKMANFSNSGIRTSNSFNSCAHTERIVNNAMNGTTMPESYMPIHNKYDSNPPRLLCSMCDFYALSGVSLVQHLESHGSVHVKCGKCEEYSERFTDISNHISNVHVGELVRISITMKTLEGPSIHMVMLIPSPNFPSCSQGENGHVIDNGKSSSDGKILTMQVADEEEYSSISDDNLIYACSECGTCITGLGELEKHAIIHQSGSRRSGNFESDSQLFPVSSSLVPPSNFSPGLTRINPLSHSSNTIEFRCKECGFWRIKSDPVIQHIQAVHMSGNIIHSLRLKCGQIKSITIRVFTPLSSQVLS